MRKLLVLVAVHVLGACGGGAPHPARPIASSTLAPADAPVVARATTAPSIAWAGTYGPWKLDGLPAVARGGELVVLPVIATDGGRGYTNLRLEIRDRGDRVVRSLQVLSSDEVERLAPDGKPGPELARRIADANRELAVLHGEHDLVAMHALEVQPPADGGAKHLAIGDGLDVDWDGDHLHVFRHNADRSFITLDGHAWLAHPRATAAGPCSNPAFLANAYHAPEISVLVVELGFTGSDLCWEPGNQPHVVAW